MSSSIVENVENKGFSEESKKIVKESIKYLQEENMKMESIFKKLYLFQDQTMLNDVKRIAELQISCDAIECSIEAITLSTIQKKRSQDNYASKLKLTISVYVQLNKRLTEEIEMIERILQLSKEKIASFDVGDEIKVMENKITRYEHELAKLEKKFPWLNDADYNLINMSKKINVLNKLRDERKSLSAKLDYYQGFPPNIDKAHQILKQTKDEYLNHKFANI